MSAPYDLAYFGRVFCEMCDTPSPATYCEICDESAHCGYCGFSDNCENETE